MDAMRLLVNAIELSQAAAKMNEAMEAYNEAIEAVKTAAADLASKWEGDGQKAFVANQDEAYRWYSSIHAVVIFVINTVKKVIDTYREAEKRAASIMKG
ncbi:MAG: WXG100 family type VII secretion target [Clostridia bacterium]|nr:WXG100 family type VII secretion target [Clostridia bacterium]MBO4886247.1 WXG100 family type VII secretion target [Clostridia bacterium]MBR4443981.1 WXG100 family type VII secretion target [Clostridia bacterium]